jgi:hypothetical protein
MAHLCEPNSGKCPMSANCRRVLLTEASPRLVPDIWREDMLYDDASFVEVCRTAFPQHFAQLFRGLLDRGRIDCAYQLVEMAIAVTDIRPSQELSTEDLAPLRDSPLEHVGKQGLLITCGIDGLAQVPITKR